MTEARKRILIVDDDEDIRNLMVLYLKDQGVDCVCVDCAIKGLEVLRDEESFDLIISDVIMPEMNGVEFIQHLAGFYPETKIIICSSGGPSKSNNQSASFLMELALERGASKALKKPFSKSDLLGVVSSLI
jgi:CheY-like chemotaxis protein